MLPQQPRRVPAHIPLGKFLVTEQKRAEKKKKEEGGGRGGGAASSSRTVFDICHDRNTVRGEEKRQVEGREGKRENGGVVIDARRRKKKLEVRCNFCFRRCFSFLCECVFTVSRTKRRGLLSVSHTAVSSWLRTK